MICSGLFAYIGLTSQDTTESPVLAPIFFWDRPDPTSPDELPPPEEPAEHHLDYRTHFERRVRLQDQPVFRSQFRRSVG